MKKALLFSCLAIAALSLHAQKAEVYSSSGVAVNGYDVVAYFTESKPVKGSKDFSFNWKDANWLFASQQDLDAFKKEPEKYAPQFGGYCAYGTSQGHKAPTEPDTWTIVNGKLYLNYNKQVKTMWVKDQKALIEKANENWPKVKDME